MSTTTQYQSDSNVTHKTACPECRKSGNDRSGDNLVVYDDGHVHCYACGYHKNGTTGDAKPVIAEPNVFTPLKGKAVALKHRGIPETITSKYGYRVGRMGDKLIEIADYVRDGSVVAQKVRYPDKRFSCSGDTRNMPLFGQHLWRQGGKWIVVTEGEIDALSMATVFDGTRPVVSVPSGAAGAVRAVKANLTFLGGFERVVFMFDMDDAGRQAALECCEVLPPGKAAIASLPRKDVNECLLAGEGKLLNSAAFDAQVFRPDNILHISEVTEQSGKSQQTWSYPWDSLTESLNGQRSGEVVMWASGSGSGKSTIMRELVMDHVLNGRSVGMVMLEESPEETLDDLISLQINKPVRRIRSMRQLNELRSTMGKPPLDIVADNLSDEEYEAARAKITALPLWLYDHRGCTDYLNLVTRVEHMVIECECQVVILDHITAAAGGMMTEDSGNNERLVIDSLISQLRNISERTGVHIDVVSQLKRPPAGRSYEEGARISPDALRGSGTLQFVPDAIIGMERNRQDPDKEISNTSILRVIKSRFMGPNGVAAAIRYDHETSRMNEIPFTEELDERGNVTLSFGECTSPFDSFVDQPTDTKSVTETLTSD